MRKRILALLLALVMCLSLLPTAAFAEDVTDTNGTDGTTLTDTPTTGTDDSTGAPTADAGDSTAAPTGEDKDGKGGKGGKSEDGEDADKDADSTDSTEGAAVPAPMVGSAPTPVVLGAAPLLGATNQESAHTVQGHKDCGKTTCTKVGHTCGSGSVSWMPISDKTELMDIGTVTDGTHYYLTKDIDITDTLEITANNVVLCLNGHTITLNKNGPVIEVSSGKTFTLTDCASTSGTITHGENTGCGVFVKGTFKMYGGSITGNRGNGSGNQGSGVYVSGEGTFNMYGGAIANNRGTYSESFSYGGGVYIHINTLGSGGTFNMYGGTIGGTGEDDGNSANYGGGVYMEYATNPERPATFNMYGGTIIGNAAGKEGGGIYVGYKDHFTMTGGSITNNRVNGNSSADSAGGGVYVFSDSITVGGGAAITGNKSEGVAYGGKDDNVHLPLDTKVSVNSGFNGSVGINVDVDAWKEIPTGAAESNGKNWTAVDGEGSSNAVKNNNVTYDNGDFSVNEKNGKLTCLHTGGIESSSEYLYVCERCGKQIRIKTECKNAVGNILKTQFYETASAAFEAAENNCFITMLTGAEFNSSNNSYTWDLDGKTVTLYADYALQGLAVKNGTLNLRYTRLTTTYNYIYGMVVDDGATVDVDVYPSGFNDSPSLTVKSGGKVVFKSGDVDNLIVEAGGTMEISGEIVRDGIYKDKLKSTFDNIYVANGTCADLLVDGYAFFDQTTQTIVNGNTTTLTEVTVDKHTCDFNNSPICACGRECPHGSIDFTTGKCTTCSKPLDGILVQKTAGGTTVTGKFATFNAAMDSIQPSDTNVTIKLMEDAAFEDEENGEDNTAQLTVPCTLDLNGKTLTVKEKRYMTSTGSVETVDGSLEIESAVTIKGTAGSKIDAASVDVFNGKSLTVEGDVNIPHLNVNGGSTVKLKGGTYGRIHYSSSAGLHCYDLLEKGYAFRVLDEDGKPTDNFASITGIIDDGFPSVKVVKCEEHSFQESTTGVCDWCGTQFAVERTIGTTTQYFETLSAAINDGIENYDTVTIKLLADVTEKNGEANKLIKIEKPLYLTIDLNSKTLTANISIDLLMDNTLYMTGSGTLAGTLVVYNDAEISGGTFNEIKAFGTGMTVRSLLKAGCGYQYTADKTWPTGDTLDGTSLANVSVKKIPITGVSVPLGGSYPYGDTTSLTATPSGAAEGAAVTYQWYTGSGEDKTAISGAASASFAINTLAVGQHTLCCKATVDGYSVMSNNVHIEVRKRTLNDDIYFPTAKSGLVCKAGADGAAVAQQLVTAPSMPDGCDLWYRLGETGQFTKTVPTAADQGTYNVYWYSTGNDIYEGAASEDEPETLTVTIARKTIAGGDITVTGGGYTGEPIEPAITVKDGDVTLKAGTDYTVSGDTSKTDAGTYSLTITGTGNYAGEQTANWTITRKTLTLTPNTYTVYAKKGAAPAADLAQIAKTLGMPDNDGDLTFYGGDEQPVSALPAADATTTLTLSVRSKNQQATIKIEIVVSDKIVPTVSVSDYNKPYSGAAVTVDDIQKTVTTESVTGTWTWTNEDTAPKNVADSGYYSLTFTPTDDDYSAVTATVQVTITRKTVTLSNLAAQKEYDGTAAVNENTTLSLSLSDSLVLGTDYTITASFDNANAGTGKTVTATVTLSDNAAENYCFAGSGGASVKEVTITGTNGYIAQKELTIGSASADSKYYDGTVTVSGYSVALEGFVEDESNRPKRGTDYTFAAAFDSADAGMGKTVTITVTLADTAKAANYYFEVNGSASRTITKTVEADIYRLPLDTLPTAKESVVKLRQDVSVRSGSYPLSDNVNVVLPEGVTLELDGELHFALGTRPAKVSAQIDATGMLTYTISGGKVGDKFAIPVTVTLPNFAYYDEQGGAAAVALGNETDGQTPEIDPDAGTITLSFTLEIELTGRSQQVPDNPFAPSHRPTGGGNGSGSGNGGSGGSDPINRQPTPTGAGSNGSASGNGGTSGNGSASGSASSTGTGSASGNGSAFGSGGTSGNGSASGSAGTTGSGVASPGTGDAGIAVYAMLSLSAALGMCATGCTILSRKRRRG